MTRKFKLFLNPLVGLAEWLNNMSDKGYRLIDVGNVFYYFEKCDKGKYIYAVDYVGNKSYDDFKDYQNFLKESNIRCIVNPGSIGKISKGNIRWRPYADKGAKIATSKGMIKKEFLILEKEKDGKIFDVYSKVEDKIYALKTIRKHRITMLALIGLLVFISSTNIFEGYQWSLFNLELFSRLNKVVPIMILSFIGILFLVDLIKLNLQITRYKKESDIYE